MVQCSGTVNNFGILKQCQSSGRAQLRVAKWGGLDFAIHFIECANTISIIFQTTTSKFE
jgi:hypothetical protein